MFQSCYSLRICFCSQPECWLSDRWSSLALLSSSVSRTYLSCVVATIFSSLACVSSSVSMANLSRLVAASFSSLPLLSSSVSLANLCCLVATIFASLNFLSNSFSSITSLQYFESGQALFLVMVCVWRPFLSLSSPSRSIFFASYPQPFFLLFFSL